VGLNLFFFGEIKLMLLYSIEFLTIYYQIILYMLKKKSGSLQNHIIIINNR